MTAKIGNFSQSRIGLLRQNFWTASFLAVTQSDSQKQRALSLSKGRPKMTVLRQAQQPCSVTSDPRLSAPEPTCSQNSAGTNESVRQSIPSLFEC